MKVGILTGGGDAPGLNAVIRAVVKIGDAWGAELIGFDDGFRGVVEDRWRRLTIADVTGILRDGGTILGTTNHANPFTYPTPDGRVTDRSALCVERIRSASLDALLTVGGDGTLTIAHRLWKLGAPTIGIPKTIDNDVAETLSSVGFDTAASVATEAVDRLHSTADAHHRIMVLEVMGRYSGWLALHAGLAGGADAILIPEIPYDLNAVAAHVAKRASLGARFSIVVAAEGAKPRGGSYTVLASGTAAASERLGGIGARVAATLEQLTQREARSVLLGHLQRGGPPTSSDRLLATRFGARAMRLAAERRFGTMVSNAPPDIAVVSLDQVAGRTRLVPSDSDVVAAARAVGIVFGDEPSLGGAVSDTTMAVGGLQQ